MNTSSIVGTVTKVFCWSEIQQIVKVKTNKKAFKVVINKPIDPVVENEHIQVKGMFESHPKYGEQLIATKVEYRSITSDLIKSFLVSTNGIADKTADKLLINLGDDIVNAIESKNIERIHTVGKITKTLAGVICYNWHKQAGKVKLINFMDNVLANSSVSVRSELISIAKKAYSYYGTKTEIKLRDDPYRIWAFSGYEQAKLFADALGVKADDKRHLICAVEEVLFKHLNNGSTCVTPEVFASDLDRLIGKDLTVKAIFAALDEHKAKIPRIVVTEPEVSVNLTPSERLYTRKFALPSAVIMETYVKNQLKDRIQQGIQHRQVTASELEHYTIPGNHKLSKPQQMAVQMVMNNAVSCVSGGAGTGKTSVLYCVHDIITSAGDSILQVALSGKASRRLAQQTEQDAMTIEMLIRKVEYDKNYLDQFPSPLVLIDEASMVDLNSMYRILVILEGRSARLVFVGDWAQLPPVGPGLIYHKLMRSKLVPKIELMENFRSVKDIISASEAIKNGEEFPASQAVFPAIKSVEIIECSSVKTLNDIAIRQYELHLHSKTIHVIVATNLTASTINLGLHNKLALHRKVIPCAPHFRVTDIVVYKSNNEELGLVNGSTGQVIGGDEESIKVRFDIEGIIHIPKESIYDYYEGEYLLLHGYALTCHSAQGSEFDVVVIVIEDIKLVERSWFYTAITRAKKKVILITTPGAIKNVLDRGFKSQQIEVGFEI
jgi:exodeoxyribonuclease V alpha subunit